MVRAAPDLNPDIAWALQERDAKGADSSTKDGHLIVAFSCKDYGNDCTEGLSPPLRAMNDVDGNQNAGGQLAFASDHAVRRLTPRECERLQGFEDYYTLVPCRGKPAADGPRYKSLGNAMNVAELRWILGRIDWFEREIGNAKA